jgi:hypothetical protein
VSGGIDDHALDLALAGAGPTGDDALDAAVARAAADIAMIRAGVELLADELPAPAPTVRRIRSRRGRLSVSALVAAVAVAAAIAGWNSLHRGVPAAHPTGPSPRFATDTYDYRPGSVSAGAGFPFLGYHVPLLADISASSANDAWVVGDVAWHWDGSGWGSARLPDPAPAWSLSSVATLGPADAWAVGSGSGRMEEILGTHPLAEHWDGERWRVVRVPLGGPGALNAVSADAPDDVWAAGWWVPSGTPRQRSDAAMRPLVAHWDGTRWHVTTFSTPRADELDHVVALGENDVWVSGPALYQRGTPIVRHWDGTRWRSIRAPFGRRDPTFALSATSASDAWAVGGVKVGSHVRTIAAHWDGHTWSIAPTPSQNTDSALVDVDAVSPDDVWALGQSHYTKVLHNPPDCNGQCTEIQSSFPVAIYEHWDGRRWTLTPSSSARMMFEGPATITAASDGTAMAAGGCYWQDVVTRWNGHAWAPAHHPADVTWYPGMPRRDRRVTTCLSKYEGPG